MSESQCHRHFGMISLEKVQEEFSSWSELGATGLRRTVPRMLILSMFQEKAHLHLTAEDVFRRFLNENRNIGLSTVYRVLHLLVQAKLLTCQKFENSPTIFELNEGDDHDHLICVQCGTVGEFCDQKIEIRRIEIAKEKGFVLRNHTLTLYGHCASCQASAGRLKRFG
ncbi:Fur family transcriptional regulator [Cupriavidus sp. DF5525]|uniref:Fur family transcriptional regulator n=1 Tax=Cupriavidus sp. DF5525 TaxID=3160989 RepID=UPI0035A99811